MEGKAGAVFGVCAYGGGFGGECGEFEGLFFSVCGEEEGGEGRREKGRERMRWGLVGWLLAIEYLGEVMA